MAPGRSDSSPQKHTEGDSRGQGQEAQDEEAGKAVVVFLLGTYQAESGDEKEHGDTDIEVAALEEKPEGAAVVDAGMVVQDQEHGQSLERVREVPIRGQWGRGPAPDKNRREHAAPKQKKGEGCGHGSGVSLILTVRLGKPVKGSAQPEVVRLGGICGRSRGSRRPP